jgi:hypothetical protein
VRKFVVQVRPAVRTAEQAGEHILPDILGFAVFRAAKTFLHGLPGAAVDDGVVDALVDFPVFLRVYMLQ